MTSKALDLNNNLIIENGSIKRVNGAAEVIQNVKTALLFYLGEWFLDTSKGVPYFEDIFVKPANLNNIESIIKTTVLNVSGVLELVEFTMDYEKSPSRKLLVYLKANTIYGEIILSEVTVNV